MVSIVGIPVGKSDALWLVDELRMSGRADDVTAAYVLEDGIASGQEIDDLSPGQELAVLLVLPNSSAASLNLLRRKLTYEVLDRRQ
jgi:hypothetical protein